MLLEQKSAITVNFGVECLNCWVITKISKSELLHLKRPSFHSELPSGSSYELGGSAFPHRLCNSPGLQDIIFHYGGKQFSSPVSDLLLCVLSSQFLLNHGNILDQLRHPYSGPISHTAGQHRGLVTWRLFSLSIK